MSELKVLISDGVSETCSQILTARGLEVDERPGLPSEELAEIIKGYHALVVRSATKVTKPVIDRAEDLRIIGRAGVGVDNIEVDYASSKGIAVANAPGANTIAVAEHALGLMLTLARNTPQANASLALGKWEKSKFKGIELFGKTLGLIGLGRIGTAVAHRAHAFNMRVIAFDPLLSSPSFVTAGVEESDLTNLLRESDFISIHAPLTQKTRYLIGEKEFSLCRPDLRIVNTSRGGIVDETALHAALENDVIAGAALDVFENEPPGQHPLLSSDKVVLTPHLGASTHESQDRVAEEIAESVAGYLLAGERKNVINAETVRET